MMLYHSGVAHDDNPPGRGSGRFPWGSGKDPKGKRKTYKGVTGYFKKRAEERQRAAALEREKQKEEYERKLAEDKDRVLKVGTASEVLRYINRGELTSEDIKKAVNRIENTKKLRDIAASENTGGMEKIDSLMKKLDKTNGWVDIGIKSYKKYAEIVEILDGKFIDKKKEDKKKEDKK